MKPRRNNRHSSYRRRAVSIVSIAVTAPVLLGFVALATDVGHMAAVQSETQNAVDAAALAGAGVLGEDGEFAAVNQEVLNYLTQNYLTAAGSPNEEIVELGRWDKDTRTWTAWDPKPNAVRVFVVRNDVPLYFAAIFGMRSTNVSREAIAMVIPPAHCRIWGIEGVDISGDSGTDSYDSTQGAYNPSFPNDDGDVCSCRNMTLRGDTTLVNGDARHGKDYSYITEGGASATGYTDELYQCIDPMPDFGDSAVNNDNGSIGLSDKNRDPLTRGAPGQFLLDGDDHITIGPGTYYFEGFEVRGNSAVTVTGAATFYVAGNINVNGSAIVNTTQDPWNMTFIVSGTQVDWAGTADFYGSILAPDALVDISGSAGWYGGVVGRELEISGSTVFHVDESLPASTIPGSPPVLVR